MKKTYQQEQYNELHSRPKSRYEQFQDWLNECPVQIEDYQVLINYIKGETDAKNYTPKNNRTILIDNNGNRITCHNYKELEILSNSTFIS